MVLYPKRWQDVGLFLTSEIFNDRCCLVDVLGNKVGIVTVYAVEIL